MSKFLVFATVLFCAAVARASVIPGRCPVVPVKDKFDIKQYVGRWFEIKKYFALYEVGVECSAAEYKLTGNGSVFVNNTGTITQFNGTRLAINVTGVGNAPNASVPAKLAVKIGNYTGDYWVVDTDYNNWSIVWACHNVAGGLFHTVHSWVLSRSPKPFNGDTEAIIDQALSTHNVDASLFRAEVHRNCRNY